MYIPPKTLNAARLEANRLRAGGLTIEEIEFPAFVTTEREKEGFKYLVADLLKPQKWDHMPSTNPECSPDALSPMLRIRTEAAALEFRDMKNRLAIVGANLRHLEPANTIAVDADRIAALLCSLERRAWEALPKC